MRPHTALSVRRISEHIPPGGLILHMEKHGRLPVGSSLCVLSLSSVYKEGVPINMFARPGCRSVPSSCCLLVAVPLVCRLSLAPWVCPRGLLARSVGFFFSII